MGKREGKRRRICRKYVKVNNVQDSLVYVSYKWGRVGYTGGTWARTQGYGQSRIYC